jgi:hypothetical protein
MPSRAVPADLAAALSAARGRVPIQKLPAGKAEGAGELLSWSQNRRVGRGGVTRRPLVLIRCNSCRHEVEMDVDPRRFILKCRYCGSHDIRIDRENNRDEPSLWGQRRAQKPFTPFRGKHRDQLSRSADRVMQSWLGPVDRKLFGGRDR